MVPKCRWIFSCLWSGIILFSSKSFAGCGDVVVLFDGECAFCNSAYRFILRWETKGKILKFSSLQSPYGQKVLSELGLDPQNLDTVVLIENGKAFTKSDAALRICGYLRMPWRLGGLAVVAPRNLRDPTTKVPSRSVLLIR